MFVPPLMKLAHSALAIKPPGASAAPSTSSRGGANGASGGANDSAFLLGSGLEETGNPVLALWTLRALVSKQASKQAS